MRVTVFAAVPTTGEEEEVRDERLQRFFAEATEIPAMMAEVGVTSEPEVKLWRKLETHDDHPA